ACFAGNLDRALELTAECLVARAPWLEVNEYGQNAANADLIESIRGRPLKAWSWMEVAMRRVGRSQRTNAICAEYLVYRARATLSSLGRDAREVAWLATELPVRPAPRGERMSFLLTLSWGARARVFVEAGELGDDFEVLVKAFEGMKYNPRFVHPVVTEY